MSLREKSIKGVLWSGLSQGSRQVIQLVITAVLARLLSPDDFGLIAMVDVFTGFLVIFTELGVSNALIQKQDVEGRHLDSAFWLNLAFGAALAGVLFLSAPLIAGFYGKPRLEPVVCALSLNLVISSFGITQLAILTKEMEFRKIAVRDIAAVAVSGAAGIYCALNGLGVWSLVVQSLVLTAMNTAMLWFVSGWHPRFAFSFSAVRDILPFSSNQTGFNIVNYFARNVDRVLIGRFLGSEALGIYSLAYKLMLIPLQNVSWIISRVMFPAFSQIQHDLEKVRDTYQKMCKMISLVTFPMVLGLFALAPEVVRVMFGEKWAPAVTVIRILCVCGLVQSIHSTSGIIALSQGRSDLQFRLGLLSLPCVIVAITAGVNWGINGVAAMYTAEQVIWALYAQNIINRLVGMNLGAFLRPLGKALLMSLFMAAGVFGFKYFFPDGNGVLHFAVYILCGFALYAFMLFKFDYGTIKALKPAPAEDVRV